MKFNSVKEKTPPWIPSAGEVVAPYNGVFGSFKVGRTDKSGRDFRGKGRLEYVGGHYLRFVETGEYFLKAGPDAPETLLAFRFRQHDHRKTRQGTVEDMVTTFW